MRKALIVLIPKTDKDSLYCGFTNIISLISTDAKFLANILARQLNLVVSTVIGSTEIQIHTVSTDTLQTFKSQPPALCIPTKQLSTLLNGPIWLYDPSAVEPWVL